MKRKLKKILKINKNNKKGHPGNKSVKSLQRKKIKNLTHGRDLDRQDADTLQMSAAVEASFPAA